MVPRGVLREKLADYGAYVASVLPKYVQLAQVTDQNELEICIHPAGIRPVLSFLKDHSLAKFESMSDFTAVDIPNRYKNKTLIAFLINLYLNEILKTSIFYRFNLNFKTKPF